MNVSKLTLVGLVSCLLLTAGSVLINEKLTRLGGTYWLLLWSAAFVHLGVSVVVLVVSQRKKLVGVALLALLVIGQWRAIEMLAMLTIWSLRRFAP